MVYLVCEYQRSLCVPVKYGVVAVANAGADYGYPAASAVHLVGAGERRNVCIEPWARNWLQTIDLLESMWVLG